MMGMQNDTRDRGEITRALNYYDTVLPMYRRRAAESQQRLDELLRERDWALERKFVLDHDYQEAV
jgi:hypothetical protein